MRKSKSIFIEGFYTNLSESDIENIFIDNFHGFVNFDHLAAGCQPGSWVMAKFSIFTLKAPEEEMEVDWDSVKL